MGEATPGRQSASIRVAPTMTDGRLTIEIEDNGVGFAIVCADKLFTLFLRLDVGGGSQVLGIGLARFSQKPT